MQLDAAPNAPSPWACRAYLYLRSAAVNTYERLEKALNTSGSIMSRNCRSWNRPNVPISTSTSSNASGGAIFSHPQNCCYWTAERNCWTVVCDAATKSNLKLYALSVTQRTHACCAPASSNRSSFVIRVFYHRLWPSARWWFTNTHHACTLTSGCGPICVCVFVRCALCF